MEYSHLPDLDALATLKAVVEMGGVSEAAKKLSVGQPAVTKRLRTLDHTYGIALTERVGGRLRLTEAGKRVYHFANQTLDRQLALREELRFLQQGSKSVRLEVSFAIGEHFLPDILLKFSDRFPDYQVQSRLGYTRQIQARLATGQVDMALMEDAPDHPDILVQRWMDDELWLVCGPRHPLVGTDLLPVEQLSSLSYVLRERQSSVRESMDQALRSIGVTDLKIAFEVGSTDAIVDILNRGSHVSFMPRFACHDDVRDGKLFHLKITGFRIMRTLWIARHRSSLDHPVAEALIGVIREVGG